MKKKERLWRRQVVCCCARLCVCVDAQAQKKKKNLEALAAELDDTAVGERESLLEHGRLLRQLALLRNVVRHVAELLLDLPHRLEVGRPVERVAPQQQELQAAE